MSAFGMKKDKELANLFNESPQSFSNKKRTGTIVGLIEKEAYKRKLNFDYILTGEGDLVSDLNAPAHEYPSLADSSSQSIVAEKAYPEIFTEDIFKYVLMVSEILRSGTGYAGALKENILWFHEAVKDRQEKIKDKTEIKELKERVKSLEERLPEKKDSGNGQ